MELVLIWGSLLCSLRSYTISSSMLEARRPTVIIVGSGRSGTSTIARLCHEELGICMGHYLKDPDYMNPEGYYEDLISHALVRTMVDGSYTADRYLSLMNHFHKDCLLWGAKDPWFLFLPDQTLLQLKPKLCIVAHRDLESTVKSWTKLYLGGTMPSGKKLHHDGVVPEQVRQHYTKLTIDRQNKVARLHQLWGNTIIIDFTERVEEEEIVTRIRSGLALVEAEKR